jgi:hypothetical protein
VLDAELNSLSISIKFKGRGVSSAEKKGFQPNDWEFETYDTLIQYSLILIMMNANDKNDRKCKIRNESFF